MIRRSFRIGLMLGVLAGLAFAVAKVLGSRAETAPAPTGAPEPWPRLSTPDPVPPDAGPAVAPEPAPVATDPAPVLTAAVEEVVEVAPEPAPAAAPKPAKKAAAKKKAAVTPWVEPTDGVCPTSHPVKGKLASKIFHLPGMLNYERTKADRCYVDAAKAEADGLRAAKR